MHFKSICLHEWRQFREIDITLHPTLTILTGPNGSGKSTLLSLLGLSISDLYDEPFLATPVEGKESGKSGFSLGTLFSRLNPFKSSAIPNQQSNQFYQVGSIIYSSGDQAELEISKNIELRYHVQLKGRKWVSGFKISSHRAIPRYQAIQSLPVSGIKPKEAFDYFSGSQSHYQMGEQLHRGGRSVTNPVAPLKETLIGFAAFGASNTHMNAIPELVGLYDEFQSILSKLLPDEIGFEKLEVRSPEIVVVSETGEFPIDSASGGLMSIIQTAWQIFLFKNSYDEKAVVLIDEPENHLHPSLQRSFLSKLVSTFPNIQFIVATHSPFIISSVRESRIYALKFGAFDHAGQSNRSVVTAQAIDLERRATTAAKVLDDVLGVSVTIPVWAEAKLEEIASQFERSDLSQETLNKLRADLKGAGLSDFLPEAVGRLVR